jgi:hypothetical protein
MFLYLKNLHNETTLPNNLDEILRKKEQRNLAEFRYFLFRETKKSYFATTLPRGPECWGEGAQQGHKDFRKRR